MATVRRIFILLVALPLAATQSTANIDDAGLDLILLVDRSGSMSRHDVTPLIALTANLLAHNADAHQLTHRLGVVSFGSRANVDVPLVPAGIGLRDITRANARVGATGTNVLAAFHAAAGMLLQPHRERRRAVLLITDGVLSVPGSRISDYERDLTRSRTRFRDAVLHIALLPHSGTRDHELWRRLSGNRVHEVAGQVAFYKVAAEIVGTRVQQSDTAAAKQRIVLPPYLESVVFDVFRGSRGGSVSVFGPGATRPLRASAEEFEEVRLSNVLSSIVVRNPAPGVWTFRTSGTDGNVRVFSQEFFPRGQLIRPDPVRSLAQYARADLTYRVVDRSGKPLGELPAYPLSLDVRIVDPDGHAVSFPLHRRPQIGAAVFGGTNAIACDVVGRYWTEVRISTTDVDRRHVSVFHDRWSGFSVDAGPPADCRVSIPSANRARIECRDRRMPPPTMFRATLWRDGQPVATPIRLEPREAGVYEAALHSMNELGTYRLRIETPPAIRFAPRVIEYVRPRESFVSATGTVVAALVIAALVILGNRYPRS